MLFTGLCIVFGREVARGCFAYGWFSSKQECLKISYFLNTFEAQFFQKCMNSQLEIENQTLFNLVFNWYGYPIRVSALKWGCTSERSTCEFTRTGGDAFVLLDKSGNNNHSTRGGFRVLRMRWKSHKSNDVKFYIKTIPTMFSLLR